MARRVQPARAFAREQQEPERVRLMLLQGFPQSGGLDIAEVFVHKQQIEFRCL